MDRRFDAISYSHTFEFDFNSVYKYCNFILNMEKIISLYGNIFITIRIMFFLLLPQKIIIYCLFRKLWVTNEYINHRCISSVIVHIKRYISIIAIVCGVYTQCFCSSLKYYVLYYTTPGRASFNLKSI